MNTKWLIGFFFFVFWCIAPAAQSRDTVDSDITATDPNEVGQQHNEEEARSVSDAPSVRVDSVPRSVEPSKTPSGISREQKIGTIITSPSAQDSSGTTAGYGAKRTHVLSGDSLPDTRKKTSSGINKGNYPCPDPLLHKGGMEISFRNPGKYAAMSALVPGLGLMMQKKAGRGIAYFTAATASLVAITAAKSWYDVRYRRYVNGGASVAETEIASSLFKAATAVGCGIYLANIFDSGFEAHIYNRSLEIAYKKDF